MRRYKVALLLFMLPTLLNATTYYVDITSGADTNAGTSKATAWAHAPGMHNCTNTCSTTTINAGDSIILKGGETWPNASFMWTLPVGAAGNPVYIGVDKTWYAGSSWSRPIMNAGGVGIMNNGGVMFMMGANTTVDNLEITGYYWDSTVCNTGTYGQCVIFNAGQTTGQTWENLYVHGWTHAGADHTSTSGISSVIQGGNSGAGVAHDNVITGADVPGDHSMNAFFAAPGTAYNNVLVQLSSGAIISYPVSFHDNYVADIGPGYCNTTAAVVNISTGGVVTWVSGSTFTTGTSWNGLAAQYWNGTVDVGGITVSSVTSTTQLTISSGPSVAQTSVPFNVFTNGGNCTHENGFEDNADLGLVVYNNVITNVSAGLALWIAPNPTHSAYLWNNVVYGVHDTQVLDLAPPVYSATYCAAGSTGNGYCLVSGNYYLWNNTFQCGDDTTQYSQCNVSVGAVGSGAQATLVDFENNFIVSSNTSSSCAASGSGGAVTCTFAANNVVLLQATANTDGYTSAQTYAFSPTSAGSPTVGVGTNLTSSWPGGYSTNDAAYACSDSGNVAICPVRSSLTRPSTGAWDIGAYQYSAATPSGSSFTGAWTGTLGN